MEKKKKYYKVVYKENDSDTYVSCLVQTPPYRLKYQIGKRTNAPKNTLGIMMFKSYKLADAFRQTENLTFANILEVEGLGVPHRIRGTGSFDYLSRFYKLFKSHKLEITELFWGAKMDIGLLHEYIETFSTWVPKGAVCFDAVRVIKQIA